MKLKSLFNLLIAIFLFAMAFSPPETKAQAYVNMDTLKTGNGDSVWIVTVSPYGDNVTFTIIDSSNSLVDTVKVYEILPLRYDTVAVDATLEGAKFDSMVVNLTFIPGDNTSKTYVLRNRQPWKLKFVRTNANAYAPKTYIIVRARTRFYNSIERIYLNRPTQTAYIGYMPDAIKIEDKILYLRDKYNYDYVLPNPMKNISPVKLE